MLLAKNASKLSRSITMTKVNKIRKVVGCAIEEHMYQLTSHPSVCRTENLHKDWREQFVTQLGLTPEDRRLKYFCAILSLDIDDTNKL